MLFLKRKATEQITIDWRGERVTIKVHKVTGVNVTIGIDAPRDALVLRSELDQREVITDLPAHDGPESRQ
jgi:carbon storage regulator CsrA